MEPEAVTLAHLIFHFRANLDIHVCLDNEIKVYLYRGNSYPVGLADKRLIYKLDPVALLVKHFLIAVNQLLHAGF